MKRKQFTALLLSTALTVSGMLTPFMELPAYAAEEQGENTEYSATEEENEAEEQETSDVEEESSAALTDETADDGEQNQNTEEDALVEEGQDNNDFESSSGSTTEIAESEQDDSEEVSDHAENGTTSDGEVAEEEEPVVGTTEEETAEEAPAPEEGKDAAKASISFVLNKSELELKREESFQLTAEFIAEQSEEAVDENEGDSEETSNIPQSYSVEWESSKSSAVSVDNNGLVTALKAGSAVITASTEIYDEDEEWWRTYSAKCTVIVTAEAEGKCGDNLTWKIDVAGNLVVSGTGSMYDYDYEWDDDIGEYVSTSPFSDFAVKTIVFEKGVTSVGSYAFYSQKQLTGITFYPGMEDIDYYSFRYCSKLSNINFQGKITEWKDDYGIYRDYEEEDEDFVYQAYDTNGTTILNLTEIGTCDTNLIWAIDQNKTLLIYGKGSIDTDDYCPWCYSDIKKAVIKSGVTGIGSDAFYGCDELTSMEIPVSVKYIDDSAFDWDYDALKHIYYAGTVTQWFDKEDVTFGESTPLIHCLSADKKSKITIYEKGKIDKNLSWILNGQGTLTISGKGEMNTGYPKPWNAYLVKKAVIGSGVTSIGVQAFSNCENMTSVTIPNTVRKIGYNAFSRSGITSLTIPSSVREIGYDAFVNCAKLKTVKLPTSITSTPDFTNCVSLTSIVIPKGTTSIGSFDGCKSLQKITIPSSVTNIQSFEGCTSLTNISLPDSVWSIGSFAGCTRLVSVKLPAGGISYLDSETFKNCTKLTTITNLDKVREIGKSAFSGCKSLKTINLRYVRIINDSAFENCSSLTTVTFPVTLTEVGYYAFNGCSKLATVNYEGTAALWKKIKIGKWNTPLTKAKRKYGGYTKESPKIYQAKVKTDYDYDHINKDGTAPKKRGISLRWEWIGKESIYDDNTIVFRIYRKGPGDKSWVKLVDLQDRSSYFDTSVKWGTYQYTVRCMNSSKTKYISDYDKKGVTVKNWLATPTLSTVASNASGVQLKWKKATGAQKYRVFRKVGNGKWAKLIDTTAVSFVDKKVSSGKKYSYKVRCITKDGKTYTSLEAAVKTVTYIKMPKITKLQNVTAGVKVTWSKSAGAAKYRVFRKTAKTGWSKLTDTTSLSYVDKTAKKGTTYIYTVRCVTADGKTFTSTYDTKGTSILKK